MTFAVRRRLLSREATWLGDLVFVVLAGCAAAGAVLLLERLGIL